MTTQFDEGVLCILPTYNEAESAALLSRALLNKFSQLHVLVVDDNSPDQTGESIRQESKKFPERLHLLVREKKEGLGQAYLDGYRWALRHNYAYVVQMDADFSHRPEDLPRLLEKKNEYDFVVGSRYIAGGKIVNWSTDRKLLSRLGNEYAALLLGHDFRDWTGGFNLWSRKVISSLIEHHLDAQGYVYQIESKFLALKLNFKGFEVPIVFEERRLGKSKMSWMIIKEALVRVWQLRFKYSSSQ